MSSPGKQFAQLTPQNQTFWLTEVCMAFHQSKAFFNADDLDSKVDSLFNFALPQAPESQKRLVNLPKASCVEADMGIANTQSRNPASIERMRIRQSLVNTFLSSYLGNIKEKREQTKQDVVLQSLEEMVERYPVFTNATAQLYALDTQQAIFAFQRSGADKVRAYIAFNLSFDVHEMPLPLGFMSSTKVTVWRSDAPKLETFVTNQAFTMPALSATIVIVGAD